MGTIACTEEKCNNAPHAKGLCCKHYARMRRAQNSPRRSESDRFWGKVQKANGCWMWLGGTGARGYAAFFLDGKNMPAHRYSYIIHHGEIPEGLEIDHICREKRCVNPAHLRACTRQENVQNRGAQVNNKSSGVRGVHRVNGRWRASASKAGKVYYFGTYDTIAEAERAAIKGRLEVFTHSVEKRLD